MNDENFQTSGISALKDTNGDGLKEFSINLAKENVIHNVFSGGPHILGNDYSKTLENSRILLGNEVTPLSASLTEC